MARSTRFCVPLAAAVAVLLSGTACVDIVGADLAQYVDREEKRFSTDGRPDVDLSTFDGSIEIRSWDRPEVLVVVEKRARDKAAADTIEVRAEQTGNRIAVHARVPDQTASGWGISLHADWRSARLIVSVPSASNVLANSGDGSIDVERVSGTIDLRSGDGSIHAREVTGDLKAHTGDGSIRLADVDGTLDIDTGDGSVAASGKFSSVRARTGDGSVTVQAAPGSAATADWNITTGDGSVTLTLPDGFGGELDAHSGDGAIRAHDISISNADGRRGENTLRGTIGAGGRQVRVRTGDGSITLRRF